MAHNSILSVYTIKNFQGRYSTFQIHLKDSHTEEGQDLFSVIAECRRHNNGLKYRKPDQKKCLNGRAVQQWNQLPREVVSPPTGGIQEKIGQPSIRSTLICIPALSRGLDSMALKVPSNSVIL